MVSRAVRDKITDCETDLFQRADAVRREICGEEVHLRGIVEFSNICSRNCTYCGLRRDNSSLSRYAMSMEEILDVVHQADKEGVKTIVLQSGENDYECSDFVASVIAGIKQRFDVAVTLCIGVKSTAFYLSCRQAGADRYLLKHETATGELYEKFHPDSNLCDRLNALNELRSFGYQIGTGGIVGLPGQRAEDLELDLLITETLDVDMAAFGPFVPQRATPLHDRPPGDLGAALKQIAAARLRLGKVHIPATTALDAISPSGRESALECGANVIMANITPDRYRSLYDIYPRGSFKNSVKDTKEILERAGRPLSRNKGHSMKPGREAQS